MEQELWELKIEVEETIMIMVCASLDFYSL